MKKSSVVAVSIPVALAIVVLFVVKNLNIYSISFCRFEFLLNTIISTSATISGFILAAVTILVGSTTSAIMVDIRKKGGIQELCWRYTESLILGLVVIVYFTFLGAVVESKNNSITVNYLSYSAALLVGYLSSVISTCYYLLSIIGKIYYGDSEKNQDPSSPKGNFRFGPNE